MDWEMMRGLVPQPGNSPDYEACLEAFPALRLAASTPQSAPHHKEGDVWVHTRMCIEALLRMADYERLSRREQEIVFMAMLLHDIAKCSTTTVDPDTGRIGHPGHSRKGAVDARIALWDAGAPFEQREAICRIVASHQTPFWVMEGSRRGKAPEFLVRELSWQVDLHLLAMVAEADMRGRICENAQHVLDNIELFRELAREEGCYRTPRRFADGHTRVHYFRGADVHPDYPLFQEPGSRVTLLSGLPASGKNTWTQQHRHGLAVVSFDDARAALGLRHGQNEGMAAHHAIDQAKALLRRKEPFVWNATHVSAQSRQKSLDLLYAYGAEVEIVHIEQPRAELLRRNHRRDTSLSNKALQAMTLKWEVPTPCEAHQVVYFAT